MSDRIPLLVLGLGNVLLEDDGVGSAAVALLQRSLHGARRCRVLDGGTLGSVAAAVLEAAPTTVILVDAIRTDDAPPGRSSGWTATTCRRPSRRGCRRIRLAWPTCSTARAGSDRYPKRVILAGTRAGIDGTGRRACRRKSARRCRAGRERRREAARPGLRLPAHVSMTRRTMDGSALLMSLALPGCVGASIGDLPRGYRAARVSLTRSLPRRHAARGRALFLEQCALCHGQAGDGVPQSQFAIASAARFHRCHGGVDLAATVFFAIREAWPARRCLSGRA